MVLKRFSVTEKKFEQVWNDFVAQFKLTTTQAQQFERYLEMFLACSADMNITAIEEPTAVIRYHFQDSLAVSACVDMQSIKAVADVGSGGGFPGLPLKIVFPHLFVVLIETNNKKADFLDQVITELGLTDIEVCRYDWRTFLRKTNHHIDLFVSRASLHTDELVRMFKPGCHYRDAQLIYFASIAWEPTDRDMPYYRREYAYTVGFKKRRLIFFARSDGLIKS